MIRALTMRKLALPLVVLCAVAIPILFLADYLRGFRAFPANRHGANRVHQYAASQYVAYSHLFGRNIAERRLAQIASHQPIVVAYRLEGNATDLVFTFQLSTRGATENHAMIYTLSPLFTASFFLFFVFPLPIVGIMLLRHKERTGQRTLLPGLLAIALTPASTILLVRTGFCASPLTALCAGALIAVAAGALCLIRPNTRLMATVVIMYHATVVLLIISSLMQT